MKKFIKKVNKTVKNGTETILNAADLLILDSIVDNLLQKIQKRILSYNYSTITLKDEINNIYNEWINEIYDEYDDKVGESDDEKSNISVRRRKLGRGLQTKLDLFYQTYENYLISSKEIMEELKLVDDLIQNMISELIRNESTFDHILTPDVIGLKYNEIKNNQIVIFHNKLSELSLTHLEPEVIESKKALLEEKFDECENQFLEKRQQITQELWKLIQDDFQLIITMIQEKLLSIKYTLPVNSTQLQQNLQLFQDLINQRIEKLLPGGLTQINSITVYMTQKNIENSIEGEKLPAYVSVANIQQQLFELSFQSKQENKLILCKKITQMISDHDYKLNLPTPLIDLLYEG